MKRECPLQRVLVVGDNCLDCYRGEVEAWYPGGNAVNVAVYLRRQGLASSYHGYLGDDAAGGYLRAALEAEGVDLSLVEVLPGATGRTFVEVRGGERVFVGDDPGVQVPFRADLSRLQGRDYALAHFSGFTSWDGGAQRCQPALVTELEALAEAPLSLDFSEGEEGETLFTEVGGLLTCAFFSRPELTDREVERFILSRLKQTRGFVVVTRGARGSAGGRRQEGVIFQAAEQVPVVDTLGAGDAFIAGFLGGMLAGEALVGALATGTRLATQVLGQQGAWTNAVVRARCRSFLPP